MINISRIITVYILLALFSTLNACEDNNMNDSLYHLLPEADWDDVLVNNITYYPKDYDKDGFIHLSPTEERLIEIANKYYTKDPRNFVVITIPENKISAPASIIWEAGISVTPDRKKSSSGREWPHLYDSGINKDMVSDAYIVHRDANGKFFLPSQ